MACIVTTRGGLFRLEGERPLAFHEGVEFLAAARAPSRPEVRYAAAAGGRVFLSEDSGRAWSETGAAGSFQELSCLAVHPREPGWLLAGMEPAALPRSRDGGRVFESRDGGDSWHPVAELPPARRLVIPG